MDSLESWQSESKVSREVDKRDMLTLSSQRPALKVMIGDIDIVKTVRGAKSRAGGRKEIWSVECPGSGPAGAGRS